MSRKKWEKLEEKYAEAIKFQDILEKLQFESVGEFVELIGGLMGMINVNDIDQAKKISEAFALRIGYILDQIGYVDKVIDKNKSMRDFYEEQQKKIAEDEAKKKAEEPSQEEKFAKEYDEYLRTGVVEGEPTLTQVEYTEEQEKKAEQAVIDMMGRNPFNGLSPEERAKIQEKQGKTIEPAITLNLDPTLMDTINKNNTVYQSDEEKLTAKHTGGGWFVLSNGKKVRGKNNLPKNVTIKV